MMTESEQLNGIHIYQGQCQDEINGPYSRDLNCPVCQALVLVEESKALKPSLVALLEMAGKSGTVHDREGEL